MRLFDFIYASKLLLFAAAEGWGRRLLKWYSWQRLGYTSEQSA